MQRLDYYSDMLEIEPDSNQIHENPGVYHCSQCRQNGSKVKRFFVVYNWEGNSHNSHVHTFPCFNSMNEWIAPFLKLGAIIIAYGKVKS